MTVQATRWFEYGDPGSSDRVPVTIRTAYQTGPNEQNRPDHVEFGTIPTEDLALLDDEPFSKHLHTDGSLLLSGLSRDAKDELLANYVTDDGRERIAALIDAGCSPAEAVDHFMTARTPVSQVEWADRRRVSQQAVSKNVAGARDARLD